MLDRGPLVGPLYRLIRGAALAVAILAAPAYGAAQETTDADPSDSQPAALVVPTNEDVATLLEAVSGDTALDETVREAAGKSLQTVVDRLKQIEEQKQSRDSLAKSAAEAADATRDAKASLEKPVATPTIDIPIWRPLGEVRAQKTQADTELASAREARVSLESKIRDREVRQAQLVTLILEKDADLKKLESEPSAEPGDEDPRVNRAKRWEHATAISLAREQLQTLKQEQQTYASEAELLPKQLELAQRSVAAKELVAQELAATVARRRDTQVTSAIAAYRQRLGPTEADSANGVLALESRWLEIVRESAQLQQTELELKSATDDLRKDFEDSKSDVEKDLKSGGRLRSALGLKLQRLRSRLPTRRVLRREIADVQRDIDSVQVLQSEIEARLEELSGGGLLTGRISSTQRPPSTAADPSEIEKQESQLLRDMQTDVSEYWNKLIELKALREGLYKTVGDFEVLIDRHVLWIRSAQPYELSDLPLAWQAFQELVNPKNLGVLADALRSDAKRVSYAWIIWAAALLGLFSLSTKMRRRLALRGEEAERSGQSKMFPTGAALLMSVALTLPLILLFVFPGWRLSGASGGPIYVQAIGRALLEAAAFALPLELLRQICRQGGLATAHFRWSETTTRPLRTNLRFLLDLGIPLVAVWAAIETIGNARVQSALGRLMFASLMLVIAGVVWSGLNPRKGVVQTWIMTHPGGWVDRLRFLWRYIAAILPLYLGVACLQGYSYSTRALSIQLYVTLWLMLGLIVTGGLLKRWVVINRRRMLLSQAQQRAAEREKLEGATAPFVEGAEVDVTQVNTQTQRLIHASLIVVGVVGIAWIWSSVLPAVEYLERITLIRGEEGQAPLLTLANLVLALPIAVLTFVASRNLPGLLESVVLQRLPLDSAARYAITSLASYALIVVGIMLSANTLGLRWENIQWLVAALGVGLGFGLQEIFANFISGLILLFEQPIRVGDVVTLGDTTGVVSKIRIRATTVTNWDRQELIIPNKDLITGRLINWTLSDSTNRIVIKVGIAYGADTRQACSILEQICRDHPNVAKEPGPMVTFEGFGDSTLDLVLRCFMTSLDGRLGTVHELHTTINDQFADANIEIAFPQRDLHLRSVPPEMRDTIADRKSAA